MKKNAHGLFDNLRYLFGRCVESGTKVVPLLTLYAVLEAAMPFMLAYMPKVPNHITCDA